MKLVVGLGNPGEEYEKTRHNIGFDVLDEMAGKARTPFKRRWRVRAKVARMKAGPEELVLAKPGRFMNRSGEVVAALFRREGFAPEDLIVVVDDADLALGALRIRKKGGPGNHNGLKSIIGCIGTGDFTRLRVGIGARPDQGDMVEHVLSRFDSSERPAVDRAVREAADALLWIVEKGVESAMNQFN